MIIIFIYYLNIVNKLLKKSLRLKETTREELSRNFKELKLHEICTFRCLEIFNTRFRGINPKFYDCLLLTHSWRCLTSKLRNMRSLNQDIRYMIWLPLADTCHLAHANATLPLQHILLDTNCIENKTKFVQPHWQQHSKITCSFHFTTDYQDKQQYFHVSLAISVV